MKNNSDRRFSEFESPLPHKNKASKPALVAGFDFSEKNSVKIVSNMYHFRLPRLVKAKEGWYITYYYRIPKELRYIYDGKEWKRFREKFDINRRKGTEKIIYADYLLGEVTNVLKAGYNPFKETIEELIKKEDQPAEDEIDCDEALNSFLIAWSKRGLEPVSLAKYKRCVKKLLKWLYENKILHADIKSITTNHIEKFLQDGKFSNREYNNTFDFIRTAFNYLVKKEIITKSPCAGITKLKTASQVHRFYDDKSLKDITRALLISDPYTYLAFQSVYYLCIRSDKELMNLKVGNILWEQNKIMLDAGGTKTKSAAYIPMDSNMKQLFLDHGIDKYPADFFVFGIKGTPAAECFGTGFFSKRFRKVRDAASLPNHFTMYGAKHTRVIHLKSDGLPDAEIMSLTRHKDFSAYAKYLRDLGLNANPDRINAVSRKV